jgi:hypothetical protein
MAIRRRKADYGKSSIIWSLSFMLFVCMTNLTVAYAELEQNAHTRNAVPQSFSDISRQFANMNIEEFDIQHNGKLMMESFAQPEPSADITNVVADSFSNISRSID